MAKAGIELRRPNRVRAQSFNLFRESFVKALYDRHHEDDCDHAHTHAENRQQRAQFVRAHGVERHVGGFFYVGEIHKRLIRRHRDTEYKKAARLSTLLPDISLCLSASVAKPTPLLTP